MQLTTRGDIPISLNEKVKFFANQVNFAVSVKLNSTLTRDQPQLRPGSNDILLYRCIQLAFSRQDLGSAFHGSDLVRFNTMQLIFLHVMAARPPTLCVSSFLTLVSILRSASDPHLLCARLVLKAQGVGVVHGTVFRAAHKAHLRCRSRQRPRRHAGFVIHAAGDNRSVRVTVDKVHHHLIADARDLHPAVARPAGRWRHAPSRSWCRHPSPDGPSGTSPSHGHICPSRYSPLRPHDFRRLRAVGTRPRRALRRTVRH